MQSSGNMHLISDICARKRFLHCLIGPDTLFTVGLCYKTTLLQAAGKTQAQQRSGIVFVPQKLPLAIASNLFSLDYSSLLYILLYQQGKLIKLN